MSFVLVQSAQGTAISAASVSATWPGATTSGNLLLAWIGATGGSGTTITTPTGWTLVGSVTNGTDVILSLFSIEGAASHSGAQAIAFTSGHTAWLVLEERSGIASSSALDVFTTLTGSSATPDSGSLTTAGTAELLVSALCGRSTGGGPPTPQSSPTHSFTQERSVQAGGSGNILDAGLYDRTNSASNNSVQATAGVSYAWVGLIAAYKAPVIVPVTGSATLTGVGQVTMAPASSRRGSASLIAVGQLIGKSPWVQGRASLLGVGNIVSDSIQFPTHPVYGLVTLIGASTLSGAGNRTMRPAISLAGVGKVTAAGSRPAGGAVLTGVGNLPPVQGNRPTGGSVLHGVGNSLQTGSVKRAPSVSLIGTGRLTTGVNTSPSAFSFSGPSAGNSHSASLPFTVRLTASLVGSVVVTPQDSASGAFSAVSLTLSNTSPVGTFVYYPSASGTVTINLTNNRGLVNPTGLIFNADPVLTLGTGDCANFAIGSLYPKSSVIPSPNGPLFINNDPAYITQRRKTVWYGHTNVPLDWWYIDTLIFEAGLLSTLSATDWEVSQAAAGSNKLHVCNPPLILPFPYDQAALDTLCNSICDPGLEHSNWHAGETLRKNFKAWLITGTYTNADGDLIDVYSVTVYFDWLLDQTVNGIPPPPPPPSTFKPRGLRRSAAAYNNLVVYAWITDNGSLKVSYHHGMTGHASDHSGWGPVQDLTQPNHYSDSVGVLVLPGGRFLLKTNQDSLYSDDFGKSWNRWTYDKEFPNFIQPEQVGGSEAGQAVGGAIAVMTDYAYPFPSVTFCSGRDNRGRSWRETQVGSATLDKNDFYSGLAWIDNQWVGMFNRYGRPQVVRITQFPVTSLPSPTALEGLGVGVGMCSDRGKSLIMLRWNPSTKTCRAATSGNYGQDWTEPTTDLTTIPPLDIPPTIVSLPTGIVAAIWQTNDVPTFRLSRDRGKTFI